MRLEEIVQHLTAERDRLSTAIAALQGSTAPTAMKRRGRPPKSAMAAAQVSAPKKRTGRKPLTAAQKKLISEKMKASWATRKKAAGKPKSGS